MLLYLLSWVEVEASSLEYSSLQCSNGSQWIHLFLLLHSSGLHLVPVIIDASPVSWTNVNFCDAILQRLTILLYKTNPYVTSCRCWRVLRSWTTACCSVSTSWTRARERGLSRARQGGTERDLWLRGSSIPPPWSPSRETARLPKPSPQMTRESAQLGENTHYAHIFGHTNSAFVCLFIPIFLSQT